MTKHIFSPKRYLSSFLFVFFFFLSIVISFAQSITGTVIDKKTNETLAGAAIAVNGQKVYTDLDGNFTLANLGGSKCELTVSMISDETQTIEMDLAKNKDVAIVLKKR